MKKLLFLILFLTSITLEAVLFVPNHYERPTRLITSSQNINSSWVDLGTEQSCHGYNTIGLWLDIDINNDNNVRIRALGKHTGDGPDEYALPIKAVGASFVSVEDEYFEFNEDIDQKIILNFDVDNAIPYLQFQVQVGTDAGADAQIDSALITKGYK